MFRSGLIVAGVFFLCLGTASTQDSVTVSEAVPVETEAPAPAPEAAPAETPAPPDTPEAGEDAPVGGTPAPGEPSPLENPGAAITIEYENTPLSDAAQRSIQEEISINLIDLEPFRRAIEGLPERDKIRLTLEECIRIALEENPEINVTVYEPLKAGADVYTAHGEFDPALQGTFNYQHASTSASQQIETFGGISEIESFNTDVTGGIAGKLTYGTQYQLGAQFGKEETTFGGFIEEFSGMTNLTLTQPLLRGFGKSVNTIRIRQAENARRVTEAQLRLSMLNTVAEVIRAYWDLVGAIENLKVQETALANAERLFDINETRREIGIAADIDVLQAKAGVATRQSDLIAARARVADAGDRLKLLLGLKDGDRFSRANVLPIDRPNPDDLTLFDINDFDRRVEESLQLALEKRPEMAMSELEIVNAELEERRTRNEMLPQFDVTGSYGQGGRDHKLRQTFYGIRDSQDKVYSYGFQATVPLRNRAARGAHLRAELSTRQSEQRLEQTRQQLMANVYIAARNVLTNQALVESTRQARSMQEVNVIAEEKKLRLGTTTSFQVLQVQEDLTLAQTQEVQAQIGYEKALMEVQLAKGTLLEDLGIEFAAPDAEKPLGYWKSLTPRWK
ncbi:MAG: TolC family protein [Candidatus Hydrogenedentes bacterium]|nr:TolC family protein [Candidatus Hydrogenedentota bacterium]